MEMFRSEMNRLEEELKLGETRMLEVIKIETNESRRRVKHFATVVLTELERLRKDPSPTPAANNMELCFSSKISRPILTGEEIKGDGVDCVRVVLRDSSTRTIVDTGPIASASVEIVALRHGTEDWTGEEFNEKIVRVAGKPPLLTVDVCKLQGGVGVLENVKFRHHATDVKPSMFRLGARIPEKDDGIIVKEARTESFAVKSYRYKYTNKNEIPNLSDKIWVLKNIRRRGNRDERLQAAGVDTVEKFLIQLLIDHQKLKNIAGLGRKKWEATINHARKCKSDKVYWYANSQRNPRVVFDILGKLQLLYSEGQFFAANELSENKKVDAHNLLSFALANWNKVEPFDDLLSHQILTPGRPDANLDTGASETMDESNYVEVLDPLSNQGDSVSDMTGLARCDSFGIQDLEIVHDSPPGLSQQSSMDPGATFSDPDFFHGYRLLRHQCIDEMSFYGRSGGVGSSSVNVVPGSKTVRKWKALFCMWKWIFTAKMLCSGAEAQPARKKQKSGKTQSQ